MVPLLFPQPSIHTQWPHGTASSFTIFTLLRPQELYNLLVLSKPLALSTSEYSSKLCHIQLS